MRSNVLLNFGITLLICLTLVGPVAASNRCIQIHVHSEFDSNIPPHIRKITPDQARIIREERSWAYSWSLEFTRKYGDRLANLILSRVSKNTPTNVVIAMGGAEYLGRVFEAYLDLHPEWKSLVHVKYVYLTTDMVKPWFAKTSVDGMPVYRVGVGPVPEGFQAAKNESNVHELSDFLNEQNIFNTEKVVVVDTGFKASIPESVGIAARNLGSQSQVEAVMLAHADRLVHDIPVVALSDSEPKPISQDHTKPSHAWAYRIDEPRLLNIPNVFQRIASSAKVIISANKPMQVKVKMISSPQEINDYKEMLLGIQDGLQPRPQ